MEPLPWKRKLDRLNAICWTFISCVIVLMTLLNASSSKQLSHQVEAVYRTMNKSINFTHVAYDKQTGRIYVGAVNWLYQFNSSLHMEIEIPTGPLMDSVSCPANGCNDPIVKLQLTKNVNKLLVIDEHNGYLIVCGTVRQGACRTHQLNNIGNFGDITRFPVVANDLNSTTYAFVAPATYIPQEKRALYVGATLTKYGTYRDLVPAICSRSLINDPTERLKTIENSITATARVDINRLFRDYFIVHYKYGFHSNGFAYFVMVQRKSHLRQLEEDGYITRLARVCVSDADYKTYTEITLECVGQDSGRNKINYNLLQDASLVKAGSNLAADLNIPQGSDVLVGVFSKSRDHTNRPDGESAICVYSVLDVEQKFTENIHMCYNGTSRTRNMAYVAGSVNKCPEPGKGGNILNFCSETLKLNGTIPITSVAARQYAVTLTAITTAVTGYYTVAFVGTINGRLKKILINNSIDAVEFDEVDVDPGNSILADIHVDNKQQNVLVSTAYQVSKVRIENCRAYSSCDACLGAKNPYCGWCSLEKSCTMKAACQNGTRYQFDRSPPRWLSLGTKHCIEFHQVRPESLPITAVRNVDLTIRKLPQLPYGARYLCVFGNSPPIQARPIRNGLSCVTPVVPARPMISEGRDHVYVDLAVRSSETKTDFVHRPFAFYDCNVHTTCKSCVTSNWPCTWCMLENKCTYNATSCSQRTIVGENNPIESFVKGRIYCPAFNIKQEILVPDGVSKEIAIEVTHMPTPLEQFKCMVEIEGARELIPAKVRDNKVVCAETTYSYLAKVGQVKAKLTIYWKHNHHVDSTDITLYKCDILGSYNRRSDCSLCTTLDRKYKCSWCKNTCDYSELCTEMSFGSCPRPRIDSISPLSGPVEGGTLVTIEGSNLGTDFDEIKNRTFIGDYPCNPVEYNVSIRIVCRTRRVDGPASLDVIVGNKAGTTNSNIIFSYRHVEVSAIFPPVGPQSGGTVLYISGKYLNVGSKTEVTLDGLQCFVDSSIAGSSQITCVTTRAPHPSYRVRELTLRVDSAVRTLLHPFVYTADPTIRKIQPLSSYYSGGRSITVLGTNLASIQKPRLVISQGDRKVSQATCLVYSNLDMMCPSPVLTRQSHRRFGRDIPRRHKYANRYQISFMMDNVQSVRDLKNNFPDMKSILVYVPDPMFSPFKGDGIKLYKGESLVIEGKNLTLASEDREVNVTIGTRRCNVTSLAMNQLVCLPPEVQPPGTDEIGRRNEHKLPLVVVRVGRSLRFPIGYLRYEVSKRYEFPPEAVGGIAAGGAFLILLSIIIMIVYRRKSTQAEREYKRIQIQMDTLESNVRSECKQAFAELQTDMTDLTTDLRTSGIPTLERKTYVMKVFFPGVVDHPVLQDVKIKNNKGSNYNVAMQQFEQLLNNKYFLLSFIETLENQRTFSIRDKVNVASLLMITLINQMEFSTELLKDLLQRLIDKSVGNKHPQLMLRRTESVVEKLLTNWMSLCMYSYLKERVGPSLFLLYNAIKHQAEKGPVDVVTHDARYSLSEDRLLREQINHSWVTVQVVQDDIDEKIQCRVLDCDSIGQIKAKILDALYKNTASSLRPSIHDIDLEWRHGRGGHLVLMDDDLTTKTINGWRQVNTLSHYGVKDLAVMGLIPKQNSSYSSNCTLNNSFPCPVMSNGGCPGVRIWHLVKPVEDHLLHIKDSRNHKTVPEIFLTRLLSTKGTIQKFVDDFFHTVMTVNENLSPAVKWLFDILDESARKHAITDPEVVHAWKSNSLPLRFWVNFIKNPDFIFDINKTPTVDSCLSVIAQTFMDSCSMNEHRLGKDSPSNKLLFAKDIPRYKQMVTKFYNDIEALPSISDQEMCSIMQSLSGNYSSEFNTTNAVKELYIYAAKYHQFVLEALESDPSCQRLHHAHQMENIASTLEGADVAGVSVLC